MAADGAAPMALSVDVPAQPAEDRWVQCDSCQKWRRITDEHADISAEKWYCHMNVWDPAHNTCEAIEEPSSPDAQAAAAAAQAQWGSTQQGLVNPFAAMAAAPASAAKKAGGASGRKRKKKRGSDDDSAEDTSDTNSADEAFYAAIDAAGATRRSAREKKPLMDEVYMHGDFPLEDDKKKRPKVEPQRQWTQDADDALLSAIVKHGLGNWTNMLRDPEFAHRFEGHTANQLRNRWRKLGTQDFSGVDTKDAQQKKLAAKVETVFDNIAKTAPPAITRPAAQAVPPTQVMMQATALQPPPPPFVAYRPYPTHLFDQARKVVRARTEGGPKGSAADAELSTPMDLTPLKPKRRGRKPKNYNPDADDDADFSDADSEDSEARVRAEARKAGKAGDSAAAAQTNEFKDLDENLDNLAYMHYYDHRNDSLQMYEAMAVPMRDLKRQLTVQYGLRNQDALELMKAMADAPDLHTRRAMLARAIHAHVTHFHNAQLLRHWLHEVKDMTTQALHRQHHSKLTMEQQAKAMERKQQEAEEQKKGKASVAQAKKSAAAVAQPAQMASVAPMAMLAAAPMMPMAAVPFTPIPSFVSSVAPMPAVPVPTTVPIPAPPKTAGVLALEKLPYYWRAKVRDAMVHDKPCPSVTGSTPGKEHLEELLSHVEEEWGSPALDAALAKVGSHLQANKAAAAAGSAPSTPHKDKGTALAAAAAAVHTDAASKKSAAGGRQSASDLIAATNAASVASLQQFQQASDQLHAQQSSQLAQLKTLQPQMSAEQYEQALAAVTQQATERLQQLQREQNAQQAHFQATIKSAYDQLEAEEEGGAGGGEDEADDDEPLLPNIRLRKLGEGQYEYIAPAATPKGRGRRVSAGAVSVEEVVPNIRLRKAGEGRFTLVQAQDGGVPAASTAAAAGTAMMSDA